MTSDDAPVNKKSTVILQPSDVLHIPGLGFDGLVNDMYAESGNDNNKGYAALASQADMDRF